MPEDIILRRRIRVEETPIVHTIQVNAGPDKRTPHSLFNPYIFPQRGRFFTANSDVCNHEIVFEISILSFTHNLLLTQIDLQVDLTNSIKVGYFGYQKTIRFPCQFQAELGRCL